VKAAYLNRIVTPSMDSVICLTCNKRVLGILNLTMTTCRIGLSNNNNFSDNSSTSNNSLNSNSSLNNSSTDKEG
jgi:hypothetical protein